MLLWLDDACTTETTGAAGSNKTDLLSGGSVAGHGGGVTNVLVVTTTVGMLHRVHGHTTHLHTKGCEPTRKQTLMHNTRQSCKHIPHLQQTA